VHTENWEIVDSHQKFRKNVKKHAAAVVVPFIPHDTKTQKPNKKTLRHGIASRRCVRPYLTEVVATCSLDALEQISGNSVRYGVAAERAFERFRVAPRHIH
jgi:hypothetical protein